MPVTHWKNYVPVDASLDRHYLLSAFMPSATHLCPLEVRKGLFCGFPVQRRANTYRSGQEYLPQWTQTGEQMAKHRER